MSFYARYIPPPNSQKSVDVVLVGKRKYGQSDDAEAGETKKQRLDVDGNLVEEKNDDGSTEQASKLKFSDVHDILDKYSVTRIAENTGNGVKIVHRKKKKDITIDNPQRIRNTHDARSEPADESNTTTNDQINEEEQEHRARHKVVLSKLDKSHKRQQRLSQMGNGEAEANAISTREEETTELHGLEPMPQPVDQPAPELEKPSYSTLPSWQANAVRVSADQVSDFASLGVEKEMLKRLKKAGFDRAFPIQAIVIPELLSNENRKPSDLCISAATGSGKTMAYVVPIIQKLQHQAGTLLRAVIVLPTRELVQQVQQNCEICAAGTNLKIATALGSKTIEDERKLLVQEELVYDPAAYREERESPIDWSTFSTRLLMERIQNTKPLDAIDHVRRFRSKVDILITTPGRLVDHLKSTLGFNLDYVDWLVVDEADRLLNESYQEWMSTLVPALQSTAATKERDDLLKSMRLTPPTRYVRKILLSATMTKDISKLNSLELENPKLIVLTGLQPAKGGENDDSQHEAIADAEQMPEDGAFNLPNTLTEHAIGIKDGSEKPLYLLRLLLKHLNIDVSTTDDAASETDSSSSSSDSDSESTDSSSTGTSTASGSDSEDDNDASSGSESSPSSVSSSSSSSSQSSDSDSDREHAESPAHQTCSVTAKSQKKDKSKQPRALIFARSTASASRLARLLSILLPKLADQISLLTRGTASSASSRRAYTSFRNSRTRILIATDRASRGLDVPDLEHVISYDVPASALTYVHRVGRTARAGKQGHAWTLVEHREGAWFWREIGGKAQKRGQGAQSEGEAVKITRRGNVRRDRLDLGESEKEIEALRKKYKSALQKLGEEVKGN